MRCVEAAVRRGGADLRLRRLRPVSGSEVGEGGQRGEAVTRRVGGQRERGGGRGRAQLRPQRLSLQHQLLLLCLVIGRQQGGLACRCPLLLLSRGRRSRRRAKQPGMQLGCGEGGGGRVHGLDARELRRLLQAQLRPEAQHRRRLRCRREGEGRGREAGGQRLPLAATARLLHGEGRVARCCRRQLLLHGRVDGRHLRLQRLV